MSDFPILIEGMTIESHRRAYPERWLLVRSAWPQMRQALLTAAFIIGMRAGSGQSIEPADGALIFGLLFHAFITATDPPWVQMTWHLDKRTPWLRFRAWWSK